MKLISIIIGILLISFSSLSQIIKKEKNKISFSVSNVTVAKNLLRDTSYKSALEMRLDTKIESFALAEKDMNLVPTHIHAFVAALHIAFAQHRPMVISPDMIWLMICQGAAIHIDKNQDSLRNKLVDFKGKKEIVIRRDDFVKGSENNDWTSIFPQFSEAIQKYLKDSLYQMFVPQFTTTELKEKCAFEIAFMDAMSSYFDYTMESFCGIPQISLEGSAEDWKWIADNSKNLEKIGMKKWNDNLQPILDEFVKASKGDIDTMFWQSIYKYASISGGDELTGWIIKFFPYILKNNEIVENSLMEANGFVYHGLLGSEFPLGISKVDLKWLYYSQTYPMRLLSGFIGIGQDSINKALRPEISWAIIQFNNNRKRLIKSSDKIEKEDGYYPRISFLDDVWIKFEESLDITVQYQYYWESMADLSKDSISKYNLYAPIIFPSKCNTYNESRRELNNYINEKVKRNHSVIKAKITFVVDWIGKIDRIKILEINDEQYSNEIISILNSISGCQPAKYHGRTTNAEVFFELEIN